MANEQVEHKIPVRVLALRLTVEIFRVLTRDSKKLTPYSLIDYYNATELL